MPGLVARLFQKGVIALPALFCGYLIYRYGVDFPWQDEWDGTSPLFEKMAAGTLGVSDFFAQHNEHRIFFPRIIFFGLGRLTRWNIRAELFVVWLLTIACLFNIGRLARIDTNHSSGRFWILFAASILLFSPLAYENFLWGFQIGFLLPLACLTAALWIAVDIRPPHNFILAAILCTVSTFSIASGFLAWFLVAPLLFRTRQSVERRRRYLSLAIWAGLFVAEMLLYFHSYQKPAIHPSLFLPLQHPVRAVGYILAFLGSPFSYATRLNPVMLAVATGGALLLVFVICAVYVWRHRENRTIVRRASPWLVLGLAAVAFSGLTMLGRLGFGIEQARSSRYLPFAVLLPIALVALVPMIYSQTHNKESSLNLRLRRSGLLLLGLIFGLLTVLGSVNALSIWPAVRQLHLCGKARLQFINVVPEADQLTRAVFPDEERLKTAATVLSSLKYLRPPVVATKRVSDVADSTKPDSHAGAFAIDRSQPPRIELRGVAILPMKKRPADVVLISYDNADHEPIVCAVARAGAAAPGAGVSALWWTSLPLDRLPGGDASQLKAWAFDAETGRAYRLEGPISVRQ
ncbi:MAG: hypothetical protein ACJ8M1_04475 [Chthoniobacterales bacterium]